MIVILARDPDIARGVQQGLRDAGREAEIKVDVDATNMRGVRSIVAELRPQAVVHMAFLDDAVACEANPDRAFLHNAESVINLAAATLEFAAIPIVWSPAHVLAGAGRRAEDDTPTATSTWTESRIRGEVFLRRAAPRGLVIRSGPVLSPALASEARRLANGVTVGSALVQPVLASWLGAVLHAALVSQLQGVVHVPTAGPARPEHEIWKDIAERVGAVPSQVKVDPMAGAGSAVLRCDRLDELSDVGQPPDWTTGLARPRGAGIEAEAAASPHPGLSASAGAPLPPDLSASAAASLHPDLSASAAAPLRPDLSASAAASPSAGGSPSPGASAGDEPVLLSRAPAVWTWVLRPGSTYRWRTPRAVHFQVASGKAFLEAEEDDVALKGLKHVSLPAKTALRVTVPEPTVVIIIGQNRQDGPA